MQYRAETTSLVGFVQQIACCYLRHGYWWYVTGYIPDRKDPELVDRKLITKYEIDVSESTRSRRKRLGRANLQYIRHDRLFVLLATKGEHRFFEEEQKSVRDFRRIPLSYCGYAISYRAGGRTQKGCRDPKWHAHVAMERQQYLALRDHFVELAGRRSADDIATMFQRLPFEPYAPVRRQQLNILRVVNRRRKQSGREVIPASVLRLKRRVVKPFERTDRRLDNQSVSDPVDAGRIAD